MISPETIRMYTFFSGLTNEQIIHLANAANLIEFEPNQVLIREGEPLEYFYIVIEGEVAITTKVPDPEKKQKTSKMLAGEELETKEIQTSIIEGGNVFAWSAIVPPYIATANAKGKTHGKAIQFDAIELRNLFEKDPKFGYLMVQKAAEIIRDRMNDLRIETLLCKV